LEPLKLSIQWRKTLIKWAWNGGSTTIKCENEKYLLWHVTYLCAWAPCRWCTTEDRDSVWNLCTQKLHILHHWKQLSHCAAGKNFLDSCTVTYQNIIITDISSLILEISGTKSTRLQHSAIHKHPTGKSKFP
jgi:hypothetical protein